MWANIKNVCIELGQVLTIKIIHLDFEIAAKYIVHFSIDKKKNLKINYKLST